MVEVCSGIPEGFCQRGLFDIPLGEFHPYPFFKCFWPHDVI